MGGSRIRGAIGQDSKCYEIDLDARIADNAYYKRYKSSPHATENTPRNIDRKAMQDSFENIFDNLYGIRNGMVADKLGLYELIMKWRKAGGIRMICGKSIDGAPCLFEFKDAQEGTGRLNNNPKYLTAMEIYDRYYYLAGDAIMFGKGSWSTVARKARISKDNQQTGLLKLALTILRGFKEKTYKFGYIIVNIVPNGNGTGYVELQPIVFAGGDPCPIGRGQRWAVNYRPTRGQLHRDLNADLEWKHTADNLVKFADDLTTVIVFVTDVASGGIKKILTKGGSKALSHMTWKYLLKKISKKVRKKLPAASRAFVVGCMSEIAKIFDDNSLNPANKIEYEFKLSQKINAPGVPKKILIAGFSKFISVLLSEASGSTLDEFLPSHVVTSFSNTLVTSALKVSTNLVSELIPNLMREYGDAINPKTGKLDDKKYKKAIDDFTSVNKKMFDDCSKSLVSNLVESIM